MREAEATKGVPGNRSRVVLLTPIAAHYRRDVYAELCQSERFEFTIVSGNSNQGIAPIEDPEIRTLPYRSFRIGNHRFYYLRKCLRTVRRLKPDILLSSGVDFHHIHILILFLRYRIMLRKPFFWWSQGTAGHQGKAGRITRAFFYRKASGVLLYSQSGAENLKSLKVPAHVLTVIGNCLNREDYGYMQSNGMHKTKDTSSFRLLFTGRISEKVDMDALLTAVSRLHKMGHQDIRLDIVGSGDLDSLKNRFEKLHIAEQVKHHGPLYGIDLYPLFQKADLFVYPGRIGLSILHAFSFGLPVLTQGDASIHFPEIELLEPGVNGDFYVERKDGEGLEDKILLWKQRLASERNAVAESCVNRVKKLGYEPESVARKIIQFLDAEA